jgi:small nuclear ribonucleoprotein (snRNP)-like protein
MSSQGTRDYHKHLSIALNSIIKVIMDLNYPVNYYLGTLVGIDTNTNAIVLENAQDEKHTKYEKIFIHGSKWVSFSIEAAPFPIHALAERLAKVLPNEEIKVAEDNTISLLGGKLIVNEKGVEGKGPTRERIQKVFDGFLAELSKSQTP